MSAARPSAASRTASRQRRPPAFAVALALGLFHAIPAAAQAPPLRVVPLDDATLAAMVLTAAGAQAPVLLFDPADAEALKAFVSQSDRPVECLVRSAALPAERQLLETTIGTACTAVDDLLALAGRLWPQAKSAVIVPAKSYDLLVRGAALAGAAGAALLPAPADAEALNVYLSSGTFETVYALPGVQSVRAASATVIALDSPEAVTRETLRLLPPPSMVVVANPKDRQGLFSPSSLSLLAPLIAATHHAPLVLVNDPASDAVEAAVQRFIDEHQLPVQTIYLVGDELALRSHRVPDPVFHGGGPEALGGAHDVRVELFSEMQHWRPQDYVVGRFVAENAALGSATLARQLHTGLGNGERVVILSNAEAEFALGETISRTTASEVRNAGIKVRARFNDAVNPAAIQDALEHAGTLVWEGHARDLTLEERGGTAAKRTPPLVILQGCYTLDRSDPFILFERGTQAIVATSAAIYSASGSAFARALMDALVYDGADLGTAVRNARNYLLAVTELKKRRGHRDWTKTYRAALAFALWGDPTARPALPAKPPKLPPAQWRVADDALRLSIPKRRLEPASVGRYAAEPVPRAMLSGLILREDGRTQRVVKELFFDALVAPADRTAACAPAPGWEVVSLFAPRTRTLSVLTRPAAAVTPSGEFTLPLVSAPSGCDAPS